MQIRGVLTLLGLAAAGCSSDADDPVPTVSLCDGSMDLTLRIFLASLEGREVFGGGVRVENGFPSFAVDGQCQYFMAGGWMGGMNARDYGWRRGVVSDELRRTLEAKAGAEDLRSVYDCGSGFPVSDASPMIISNSRSSIICLGGATQPILDVFALIHERASELWTDAQALDGALHVRVRASDNAYLRRYPWPSGLTLQDYFEPQSLIVDESERTSKRVDAVAAAPLRAVRERFLNDMRPGTLYGTGGGIPVVDGDVLAMVFMRDALPYEDERGLWPLPSELK